MHSHRIECGGAIGVAMVVALAAGFRMEWPEGMATFDIVGGQADNIEVITGDPVAAGQALRVITRVAPVVSRTMR